MEHSTHDVPFNCNTYDKPFYDNNTVIVEAGLCASIPGQKRILFFDRNLNFAFSSSAEWPDQFINSTDIAEVFKSFGVITRIRMLKKIALVQFEKGSCAQEVINKGSFVLKNRPIKCSKFLDHKISCTAPLIS